MPGASMVDAAGSQELWRARDLIERISNLRFLAGPVGAGPGERKSPCAASPAKIRSNC